MCARIAGKIAGCAALASQTTRRTLAEYERRWQKQIGSELRFGLAAHRVLAALSDSEIDAVLAAVDDPSIIQVIVEEGDIDHPSRLFRSFFSRQSLWPRILTLISALGGWKRVEELARLAIVQDHANVYNANEA